MPVCTNKADFAGWGTAQRTGISHQSTILSLHHSAPNKHNFGPGRRKDKCLVDKELRRMGHGRGREKTKPIWRSDEAGRGGGQDTGRSRPGRPRYSWALTPMLRNTLRRHYGQDFCAKQTQFWTEPFRGQVLCRQGLAVHWTRGERPQNKPNFRDCADPEIGGPRGQLCETRPIPRGR